MRCLKAGTIRVIGLYNTQDPKSLENSSVKELNFLLDGIEGERHLGFSKPAGARESQFYKRGEEIKNHRQWSAISQEELNSIASKMDISKLDGAWIGANIVFEGTDQFSKIPPFSRLVFENGLILVVYEENAPCHLPQPFIEGHVGKSKINFSKAGADQRGLVGWIERAGTISVGEACEIYVPKFYSEHLNNNWLKNSN
ncbi:MAG: sulfurase [Flavobacteriales bacterium]|nr:sulfurase [Flavobacteriales bacterium]